MGGYRPLYALYRSGRYVYRTMGGYRRLYALYRSVRYVYRTMGVGGLVRRIPSFGGETGKKVDQSIAFFFVVGWLLPRIERKALGRGSVWILVRSASK